MVVMATMMPAVPTSMMNLPRSQEIDAKAIAAMTQGPPPDQRDPNRLGSFKVWSGL